jgi:hypothetical protein
MKSPAQHANDAKVLTQQKVIKYLRIRPKSCLKERWLLLPIGKKLWEDVQAYKLDNRQERTRLNKVAFPDFNHEDVDAALKAGNNLHDLYDLALGKASIEKDSKGNYQRGRKGHLKINK